MWLNSPCGEFWVLFCLSPWQGIGIKLFYRLSHLNVDRIFFMFLNTNFSQGCHIPDLATSKKKKKKKKKL